MIKNVIVKSPRILSMFAILLAAANQSYADKVEDHSTTLVATRLAVRSQFPNLIEKAKDSNSTYESRSEAIEQLGNSTIHEAQEPLLNLLKANDQRIRVKSARALWGYLSDPDSEIAESEKPVVINQLSQFYSASDETTKSKLAEIIYRCRRPDLALPYIQERLHKGDASILHSFISYGSSQVYKRDSGSAELKERPQILSDDMTNLKQTLDVSYPPNVRVIAASVMAKFGKDDNTPLGTLREIIHSNASRDVRMGAFRVLHDIGTDEAYQIINEATKIPDTQEFAQQLIWARTASKKRINH